MDWNKSAMGWAIRWRRAACAVAILAVTAPQAAAFFPFGGTSSFTLDIQLIRWSLQDMDDNGDGDVQPNEGIPITIEEGPVGFTQEEVAILEDAFDVWENVDTAFVGFQYTSPVTDPLELTEAAGSLQQVDGLNVMAMQTANDPAEVIVPDVQFPVLATTQLTFVIDDTFVEQPDGTQFPLTGGRIVEVDIVFDAASHRPAGPGQDPVADLEATAVHEIGHLLGLGHTPMENVTLDPALQELVETAVWVEPDATNTFVRRGVTPTMFPTTFFTDDGVGDIFDGGRDLAPDDIAGVTFLYPRANQDQFFTLKHYARTQSRAQIPSFPLLGGLVTAWADVDNDPLTPRVPLMATMTGLFEPITKLQQRGNFTMFGLPKELVTFGSPQPFQATYTFTIEPITQSRFPFAVTGQTADPASFDSTHGVLGAAEWTVDYDTFFPSEVFNKDGELFGAENFDAGTPLAWDPLRNRIVSPSNNQTFDSMLKLNTPMFGDKSEVCPLNVAVQDFALVALPSALRNFRDGVLAHHPTGTAFVDAYYAAGPDMVTFLKQHERVLAVSQATARGLEWAMVNFDLILGAALGAVVLAGLRRRQRVAAGLGLVLALSVLAVQPASAKIAYVTEEEMVALSDEIIEGEITNVESRLIRPRLRVVTTVTIDVVENMKGRLNKGTTIFIELPFGRVGEFMTYSPELPYFSEGDQAALFLRRDHEGEFTVVGGLRGRRAIVQAKDRTKEDGEASKGINASPQLREAVAAKIDGRRYDVEKATDESSPLPLDLYKAYIRQIAREQRISRH